MRIAIVAFLIISLLGFGYAKEINTEQIINANSSDFNQIVDESEFDFSIFPTIDEVAQNIVEEGENLTSGSCAESFGMLSYGSRKAPQYAKWIRAGNLWVTNCITPWGRIPGYYYSGRCYYEFGSKQRWASKWDWMGLVSGIRHYYHSYGGFHKCAVFASYQTQHRNPLFLCVVVHHGKWVIPGKGDPYSHTCWYLNTSTSKFYWIVSSAI